MTISFLFSVIAGSFLWFQSLLEDRRYRKVLSNLTYKDISEQQNEALQQDYVG